jgi:FdhD protein
MRRKHGLVGLRRVRCELLAGVRRVREADEVVLEEPLELRVNGDAVATLMRTPGSDRHLATGFFLGEGWISSPADVGCIAVCSQAEAADGTGNVADLITPAGNGSRAPAAAPRALTAMSSCGVCGKRTIAEALALKPPVAAFPEPARRPTRPRPFRLEAAAVLRLPARLREAQRLFAATGALHAAGLFDGQGRLLHAEEDIGRHNAVDKVIGWAFLAGRVPLSRAALQVSGRVSFEIVQKAHRAGIPFIAAVSGVSSLGIELARSAGITLAGFVRDRSFRIYAGPRRVAR